MSQNFVSRRLGERPPVPTNVPKLTPEQQAKLYREHGDKYRKFLEYTSTAINDLVKRAGNLKKNKDVAIKYINTTLKPNVIDVHGDLIKRFNSGEIPIPESSKVVIALSDADKQMKQYEAAEAK